MSTPARFHAAAFAACALLGLARADERSEPAERPLDVVLLVATGLRADTLGATGADGESLTPALDALAARSVVFDDARAASAGGTASLASLWTSRAPCADADGDAGGGGGGAREAGALARAALPEGAAALPERFARAGYLTVAYCDGGDVIRGTGFERGFEHFDSAFVGPARRVEEALDFIATRPAERPYLLVVQTYGARMPYRPSAKTLGPLADGAYDGPYRLAWRSAVAVEPHANLRNPMALVQRGYKDAFQAGPPGEADRAFVRALYAASVRELDRALGKLVDYLERRGELERTLVVVVSDYGTAFWEHGAFGHAELTPATLDVPLLVHAPGWPPARRADAAALVDLAPTLAAACGLPAEAADEGRDLFADGGAPPAATYAEQGGQLALRFGRWAALVAADGTSTALYDLAADPGQTLDVAAAPEHASEVERALELARGWRARCAR